jgi:hypothetical protein
MDDALRQAIRVSPLMQTKVEGDGETAVFRQTASLVDRAMLTLVEGNTDAEANQAVLSFVKKQMTAFKESKEMRRSPFRLVVARGKTLVAVAIVGPHHFLDGAAIGSFLSKFIAYARLPKLSWFMLNKLSTSSTLPSFAEMVLKDQYALLKQVDGSLDKRFDPANLRFSEFDPFAPDAINEVFSFQEVVGTTTAVLDLCKLEMKNKGVTITAVLVALSIKVLAKLSKHAANVNPGFIVATIGVDARGLGKWGDARDLRSKFPEVANYTFGVSAQVSYEDAMNDSIDDIALRLRKDYGRIQSDVYLRLHSIEANTQYVPGFILCATSSVALSKTAMRWLRFAGIPDLEIEFVPQIGTFPTVWFAAISVGSKTTVHATVVLPIPNLTKKIILQTIKESVEGTTVEPLFNLL